MAKVSKTKTEKKEIIRVLQIGMHDKVGGVEIFLMNYYKAIDKSKIQFDFINPYQHLCFEDEIKNMGGKIYNISNFKRHPIKYYKELKKIIVENKYDIVHVNMLSAANIIPIIIASKVGVKHIIAHSHNNGVPKGLLRKLLNNINKKVLVKKSTDFFACSKSAGKWMFGDKKFDIINNCIDIERFKYNSDVREKIRKQYNLIDKFVIGHVGRFEEQKNHEFIIDFFEKISYANKDCVLMLIGDGVLKNKIMSKVKELKLENNVLFLGNRNNVEDFYNAMDLFILPSKFEGLGIVNVEAQASGLPCIVSDVVPKEVSISPLFRRLSLCDLDSWCEEFNKVKNEKNDRHETIELTNFEQYDIFKKSHVLEKKYDKFNNKKNILVITPGALPVPAYKGGAVENLIQSYLDYNEYVKQFNFFAYSITKDRENRYKETKFIEVKSNIVFKISKVIRYFINNKLPYFYVGNAYSKKVLRILKKDKRKYDAIIVENTPYMGVMLRKTFENTPIILHLHNDYLNVKTKKVKKCLKSFDKIITISKFMKNKIDEIEKTDKVVVVYNGINVDVFKQEIDKATLDNYRRKYKINKNNIVLMYTGRLVKEKGLTELINATIRLIKNDKNIKLLIIGRKKGDKPELQNYINEIERLASNYRENIIFTDFVEYSKLPIFHKISNIQIIPSKWGEPLGNVVIEGMVSGIKQIITDDGGMTEIVNNSVNVISVENLEENIYNEVIKITKTKFYKKDIDKNYVEQFSERNYSKQIFNIIAGEINEK